MHAEFGKFYALKVSIFIIEVLSVLVTPFILWLSLPKNAPAIIDFFRQVSVSVSVSAHDAEHTTLKLTMTFCSPACSALYTSKGLDTSAALLSLMPVGVVVTHKQPAVQSRVKKPAVRMSTRVITRGNVCTRQTKSSNDPS